MAQDQRSPEEARLELVQELLRAIQASPPTRRGRWFVRRWGGNSRETERIAEELRRLTQALIFSASR